jgi:hypothetical protein
MANNEFQIPGRFIAAIFAKLHPAIYDVPPHGIDPFRAILKEFAGTAAAYSGASAVELNPQPLPPRWAYALKLADAYISEFVALDRMGNLLGGDVAKRALDQSLSLVSDIDDICPRWPRWPWPWPPIPWPWTQEEEMNPVELFVFGMRILGASQVVQQEKLSGALTALGEKVTSLSMQTG